MSKKSKWVKGSRVYSKAYGANATVVAVDLDGPKPIYIIRLDGSTRDSYNIPEKHLDNPR